MAKRLREAVCKVFEHARSFHGGCGKRRIITKSASRTRDERTECVRRRPEASLKSLICRCVPSLPKRLPGQEGRGAAAGGPPTRPQVRENCSQRLSRDARSMPNSLPFGPAITRTYASPAAQPHRCCSLSRHRRLPGCPVCPSAPRRANPAAPVRTPGTGRPRLQPLPAIADPGRPVAGLLQRRQPDRRRGNPPDPAGDLCGYRWRTCSSFLFLLGALTTLLAVLLPTAPSSRSTNNQASWPTSRSRSWPTACSSSRCSRRSCCCSRITPPQAQASVRADPQLPAPRKPWKACCSASSGVAGRCCCRCCPDGCSSSTCSPSTWHRKTILSCFAWVVFVPPSSGVATSSAGGHKAIRWTLAGFCLLMLAHFGSKLVGEFILHIWWGLLHG